jgi:RNA polymerase sigma-70 factor (ECF subfamily)
VETSLSLLERLADRPAEADWRRLDGLYRPLLRAWAQRAGLADADADDLTQEVLLVVVREVATFDRRRPGAFRSWLRVVLANRLGDFFAARRRHARPADSGVLEQLAAADSELSRLWDREHDQHVAAKALRLVQGDFSAATWQAFRRLVLDGAAPADVAAELGVSANAVLLARSRVLKRLRAELAGLIEC